jgi:hypothetical protein
MSAHINRRQLDATFSAENSILEKAEYGQEAACLTLRFLRSKLAPLPSYAWDFFKGQQPRQLYDAQGVRIK